MSIMLVVYVGMASMWTFPKLKIERDSTDNFLWKLPLCTLPRHTYFLLSNEFNISGITWRLCLSRVTFHVICKKPSRHRWFRSRIPLGGESRSLYFWANFHKCVVSKIWRFVGIFAQWQPFQNVKAKFFIPFYHLSRSQSKTSLESGTSM